MNQSKKAEILRFLFNLYKKIMFFAGNTFGDREGNL